MISYSFIGAYMLCGMMSGIIRRRLLRGWSGSKEMGGIEIRNERLMSCCVCRRRRGRRWRCRFNSRFVCERDNWIKGFFPSHEFTAYSRCSWTGGGAGESAVGVSSGIEIWTFFKMIASWNILYNYWIVDGRIVVEGCGGVVFVVVVLFSAFYNCRSFHFSRRMQSQ